MKCQRRLRRPPAEGSHHREYDTCSEIIFRPQQTYVERTMGSPRRVTGPRDHGEDCDESASTMLKADLRA